MSADDREWLIQAQNQSLKKTQLESKLKIMLEVEIREAKERLLMFEELLAMLNQ